MIQNPVRWFEIYVSDMSRAKSFYESLLDVKLSQSPFQKEKCGAFRRILRNGAALAKNEGPPSGIRRFSILAAGIVR